MSPLDALLLRRAGVVVLAPGAASGVPALVRAAEIELAALGVVIGHRLRARLGTLTTPALGAWLGEVTRELAAHVGGGHAHVPLFKRFPLDVPEDTFELWVDRALVHYFQEPDQPCLTCDGSGQTRLLEPCGHVVCPRCWDPDRFSACPICGRAVAPDGPVTTAADPRGRRLSEAERVRFKRVELVDDLSAPARELFERLARRPQALNPDDLDALGVLVQAPGAEVIGWLPDPIPLRENRAVVFGALLRALPHAPVLAAASPHLDTATDLLRLLAVASGAPAGLVPAPKCATSKPGDLRRWSPRTRALLEGAGGATRPVPVVVKTAAFKPLRLPRASRRTLLALLERLDADALVEDMQRHRGPWLRLGQALHPFEHARRFPKVARAFTVLRRTRAPELQALALATGPLERRQGRLAHVGFKARVRRLRGLALAEALSERPGELARGLDLCLRQAPEADQSAVADRFIARLPHMATPALLTISTVLAARVRPGTRRVFFPRGPRFLATSAKDERPPLPRGLVTRVVSAIEDELLARLARKAPLAESVLDEALRRVIVPFNERSASPAAVNLPRGSRLDLEAATVLRLFLHWCQPPGGLRTDLDLSVAFYDEDWVLRATCSYYLLRASVGGLEVARSAGDRTDAPHPEGATELVDLLRDPARRAGLRYAVMVVNAYSGLAFGALERAFAGIMLREDADAAHFDPRTVRLRFNLQGEHGVYAPLVCDLARDELFWLDASAKGRLSMNNVATSDKDLARIAPQAMAYFAEGVRPDLFRLAALHAAARTPRVFVRRGALLHRLDRAPGEPARAFFQRILEGRGGVPVEGHAPGGPCFAALLHGDLDLPEGSEAYALFRERLTAPLAAADLLA